MTVVFQDNTPRRHSPVEFANNGWLPGLVKNAIKSGWPATDFFTCRVPHGNLAEIAFIPSGRVMGLLPVTWRDRGDVERIVDRGA